LKRILNTGILIIFLLELNFFYVWNNATLSVYNSKYQKILLVLITLILFELLLAFILKKYKTYIFGNLVISFVLIWVVEFIYSKLLYEQNFMQVIKASNSYLLILLYFIFVYYLSQKGVSEKFLHKILVVSTIILSFLFIIQWNLYHKFGIFLNIPFNVRFDELRITEGEGVINVGIVIAFALIFNKQVNKGLKIISILAAFIGLFELIFVQKTRLAIFCVLIGCFVVLLIKFHKNVKSLVLLTIILTLVVIASINSSYYKNYISSADSTGFSYTARQQEALFYLDQIKQHPLLSMGFIDPVKFDRSFQLVRGPQGYLFKSDVGIIGFVNTFGIIGFFWYLAFLYKTLKYLFVLWNSNLLNNYLELAGIWVFLFTSSFTLIIMDSQRIIALPVYLAILDGAVKRAYEKNLIKFNI